MSAVNPLWSVPRIRGELIQLGFNVAQSKLVESLVQRRGPPSQNRGTFLRNHTPGIAAIALAAVPTISVALLHCLVVIRTSRCAACHN